MPAQRIPRDPAKKRAWILYQLHRRNLTFTAIARQLQVSPQAVSKTIDCPSQRIEAALAVALHVTPADIWPDRYREPPVLDFSHIEIPRSDPTPEEANAHA